MDSFSLQMKHIFYIVLYSTISVAAVGGNGIVIYLIAKYRRMRSVTNLFLLNCALGDVLMAVLCIPFTFISNLLLDSWVFGRPLCHLISYAQAVSVFVSAYTLVAISVDRYIAIIYPLRPRMTRRHGLQLIALIWLVALLTPLPTALLSSLLPIAKDMVLEVVNNSTRNCGGSLQLRDLSQEDRPNVTLYEQHLLMLQSLPNHSVSTVITASSDANEPSPTLCLNDSIKDEAPISAEWPTIASVATPTKYQCVEDWTWADDTYRSYYSMLLMGLQYGLPFTVLVFTYTRIAIVVWGKRVPGEADNERDARMAASKRKMVKMMIVCVLTFTLCWLPFNILIVVGDYYNVYEYEYIEYVWFACHWLAMSHAVYNPVIYISMNPRFRYGFRRVLGKCLPCLLPEFNDPTTNGRSVANIFNSSQQRKRIASQHYTAQAMVCHANKTNQGPMGSHRTSTESTKSILQKRFSCVPADAPDALTTNGKAVILSHSQSYNCGNERIANGGKGSTHNDSHL